MRWRFEGGGPQAAIAVAVWTALIGFAIAEEGIEEREAVRVAAEIQASSIADFLIYARRWSSGHGGVFVPVTETHAPSPWLAHVPDREATTSAGRPLTLVNPAWMTREILEIGNAAASVTGHITSRRPLRPENGPDAWEDAALRRLEAGAPSWAEVVEERGASRLRYVRALVVEDSCLACHRQPGDRAGAVRGGIAISVPMASLGATGGHGLQRHEVFLGVIWLLGLAGILGALADHRRRVAAEVAAARREAEAAAELAAARRLEAVGRLSSGVAHDFNNLLAPILSLSGVARDALPEENPVRADLEEIRGAALKARDLVRALQTLSRKNGAHLERVAIDRLAREGEALLRSFTGSRFGFALRTAGEAPAVVAHAALVELALANLIVNAREGAVAGRTIAVDVRGIAVPAEAAERLGVRPGRHAAVSVAEAGVSEPLLQGLEGYATVHASASAQPGGAGVGISTINGIVAQYGGAVVVREAPGAGWIVRLLLPEAPAAPADQGS